VLRGLNRSEVSPSAWHRLWPPHHPRQYCPRFRTCNRPYIGIAQPRRKFCAAVFVFLLRFSGVGSASRLEQQRSEPKCGVSVLASAPPTTVCGRFRTSNRPHIGIAQPRRMFCGAFLCFGFDSAELEVLKGLNSSEVSLSGGYRFWPPHCPRRYCGL
jgi:hypothetical protein